MRLTPLPPAVRTMLLDFTDGERLRDDRVGDHRARRRARRRRDDGPGHRRAPPRASRTPAIPPTRPRSCIVEVDGYSRAVEAQTHEVEAAAREHGVRTIRVAADDAERALLWKGRKSAFGAVAQIAPHYHLHDCVVPRTKLVEVLAGVYAIAEAPRPDRHERLPCRRRQPASAALVRPDAMPGTLERVLEASDELVRLCVDAGGALSGEHGIGLEKRDFMPLVFTADDLAAQACVRDAFDPDGRMNPQKVLPDGARCGDFALARADRDAARAAANLPEGSWI